MSVQQMAILSLVIELAALLIYYGNAHMTKLTTCITSGIY